MEDKFYGCSAVSCSRMMTGPKTHINYTIKEQCRYYQKNICTIKDRIKIERNISGKPEPGK
jgi:hypothetical protein